MNDNAPQSKSSVSTLLIAIIMLGVGFAAGHIVSDMNLIGGSPKLPEAKPGTSSSSSTPRDAREAAPSAEDVQNAVEDAATEAEGALDDAAEKAEEIIDDANNAANEAAGG